VLTGTDTDPAGVLKAARDLTAQGLSVRVESEKPPKLRVGKVYRYEEGALKEC